MGLTKNQQLCVNTLDKPIVVSAGAGSGKTFTLTARIVNALKSGYISDISEVLAITFTNKAAAEIKSRVKSALSEAGMQKQALKVDSAWVSTIHGMCSRILQAHALEIGINPNFKVIEGTLSKQLLDLAINEVLGSEDALVNAAEGVDAQALNALFSEFPVRSASSFSSGSVEFFVRALIDRASSNINGFDAIVVPPNAKKLNILLRELVEVATTAYDLASDVAPGKRRDAFVNFTSTALEFAQNLLNSNAEITYETLFDFMAILPIPGANFGSKTAYRENQAELKEKYCKIADEARAGFMQPHLSTLIKLAKQVYLRFTQKKASAGVLDSDDLLVLCARAFRDCENIANEYSKKFKLIMIDEFQDTDELQIFIAKKLAGEGAKKLCVVGDAQQSIYRFRQADVSVFKNYLESVRSKCESSIIPLDSNFRSHESILKFCDFIFSKRFAFGSSYMPLTANRAQHKVKAPYKSNNPRINLQITKLTKEKGTKISDATQIAAKRMAAAFAEFAAAGHAASDMVLLLGKMTNAEVYAAEIRKRGLACVVSGGSVFSSASEVALMVKLASALVNPHNTQALFEVLSSEMFALCADDLLFLSTCKHSDYNILRRSALDAGFKRAKLACGGSSEFGEISDALKIAVKVMCRAYESLKCASLSEIMGGVIANSGWLNRLESEGFEGIARAANVYKALRLVKSFEDIGGISQAHVAKSFAYEVENSSSAPGALSFENGNFVRIMTIHASKGLEFPIVGVADLPQTTLDRSSFLSCASHGKCYVSLNGGNTLSSYNGQPSLMKNGAFRPDDPLFAANSVELLNTTESPAEFREAIYAHENEGEQQEALRLLYVALTRAKEALVMSACCKQTKDDPSGLSKYAWGTLEAAFMGEGACFEPGVSMLEFAPGMQARIECEVYDLQAVEDALSPSEARESCETEGEQARERYVVPNPLLPNLQARQLTYTPTSTNVFSYSSICELTSKVAENLKVEAVVDEACDATLEAASQKPYLTSDADSATVFGSAFHRIAEYAVNVWQPGAELCCPPVSVTTAIADSLGFRNNSEKKRLCTANMHWFASNVAARVSAAKRLRAEVPFMLEIPYKPQPIYLEGEIDLLAEFDGTEASNSAASGAVVVDYKTGGKPNESEKQLYEKHLLQATCYAYAVLKQGFSQVECIFVRVEQHSAGDVTQPQTITYSFSASQLNELESAISSAYEHAN